MKTERSVIPALQVSSGPLKGRLFKVDREMFVIGRSTDCDLVLEPKSVSRRHAAIVRHGHGYTIKDLGSTRGTYINGHRIDRPADLQNGQVVQLGEMVLTFCLKAVKIEDGAPDSTVYAAIDMTTPSGQSIQVAKPEEKLRALQRISQAFGSTLELKSVLEQVLATLFEIFPRAQRGFVLLVNRETKQLEPEAIRTISGSTDDLVITQSVLKRVLDDGHATLSKDLLSEFPDVKSVSESQIRSMMCVPLMDNQQYRIGIIQIDTRDAKGLFDQDDLDLLASVASQISIAVRNAQLHQDLIKQKEIEQELLFARQVMQALLPERPTDIPGYEFWDYYEPARHVGGDYFGFLPLHEPDDDRRSSARRWAIAVGDVVGKGLPAALVTARLSAEIRLLLQGETDPARVVSRLNRQLTENGVLDMYITFLLAILDTETHRFSVVNAGHPYPLILRRNGRVEEFAKQASGLPLAIHADWEYECTETALELGETVVMYTDGVSDAIDPAGERFTDARLRKALAHESGSPKTIGESLILQVRDHVAGQSQFDDITLLSFGRIARKPDHQEPGQPRTV